MSYIYELSSEERDDTGLSRLRGPAERLVMACAEVDRLRLDLAAAQAEARKLREGNEWLLEIIGNCLPYLPACSGIERDAKYALAAPANGGLEDAPARTEQSED